MAQPIEGLEQRELLTIDVDQPFSVPGGPVAQVSERFDADASYDLVTLSATGDLTVALNRGDGAWSSIQMMGLGLSSGVGLAAGRVNSDPFADLAIQSADQITIAVSNGAGEFTVTQALTPALPGQLSRSDGMPVGLTFGLFDQDLSTDLAVVVPGTNELLVYRGISNGSLGTPVRYASGGTEPVAVVTGQFVSGTAPDLAVAHRDGTIAFFAGDGNGSFSLHSGKTVRVANGISPASIESITVDDFNGDGESDLAVTATDTALLLLNVGDPLDASPIVNGSFNQGLTGWTTQIVGHTATGQPGVVAGLNGFARLTENESFLTALQQTFTVPASPQTLSFDVRSLALQLSASGIPDAFEVSLLNSTGDSLVATHRPEATSFYNVNANGQTTLASGVTLDGTTVTVDISGLTAGTHATLYFDLVGNPPGASSTVVLDNVVITPERMTNDTFTVVTLPGSFQHAMGVDSGDINGDGLRDVLITDRAANSLVVFVATTSGGFTRTDVSLAAFGTQPLSVIATELLRDGEDDVAVGLYGSNVMVSPLTVHSNGPEISSVSSLAGSEGQLLLLVATVRDPGSSGPHAATVNWGDGTSSTTAVNLTGGTGTISLPHVWKQDGSYSVTITVTDALSHVAKAVVSAAILNVNPTLNPLTGLTGDEGQTVTLATAFSDPGILDSHSALINWGDGTTTPGTVAFLNGSGSIAGNHAYADNGVYIVSATVQDESGQPLTLSTTATISNLAPVIETVQPLHGSEGSPLNLRATFYDPGIADTHSATITWNDGTSSAGMVTASNGFGTITGSHIYGDNGSFAVSILLTDNDDATASLTSRTQIANVNPTAQAAPSANGVAKVSKNFNLAVFTDPGFGVNGSSEAFKAIIKWGDGTPSTSGTVDSIRGSAGVETTGTVSGTHTFAKSGKYFVTVTISDDDGGSATVTTTVIVSTAMTAPVVGSVKILPGIEGSLRTLNAVFTDVGDTGTHSALIQWGDGTTSIGSVTFASGSGTVTGSHVYADDDKYSVRVTVTDSTQLSGSSTTKVAIANFVPAVVAVTSRSVIVGTPLSGVIATFTDQGYSDAAVSASETFSGTINWGDGTPIQTASLTITNGATGVLTRGEVSGTHTFACIGTYTVRINVSDDDGGIGPASFQVAVTAAPKPPAISGPTTIAEGSVYVLKLNAHDYSPTAWNINWGDGTSIQTVLGNTTTLPHTYADNRVATITATAVRNSGSVTAAPLTVTVFNVAPTIAVDGLPSIGVGATYSLSVSARDSGQDRISSWIVSWGDGATSTVAGTLTTLTHIYAVAATRKITVSAIDEDGKYTGPSKTITVAQSTGNKSKFIVVDADSNRAYRYGSVGASLGNFVLTSDSKGRCESGSNVRGVTTTATGSPVWTVDQKGTVRVYDPATGGWLGAWTANGLSQPEDIATDGTDIWIVDRKTDRIYRYAGAASRRSGSQSAASSFTLHSNNKDAFGLVTDGLKFWVVDEKSRSVFVYSVANGACLGQWIIDSRNDEPSGITIDPNGGNEIWIVDRKDDRVYRYANARTRTGGSQNYTDSFALNSWNSRPEGIADPTYSYTLNTVVSSNISAPGEVDEYQFTASVGQRVFLDIQLVQNGVLHAKLQNPDGSTIVGYTNGSSPANPEENDGSLLLTQTGTYTMRLESLTGNTPSYQVVVNDVTVPDKATITLATPLSGQISRAGETDEWSLNVIAGQNFWFQSISQSGSVRSRLYSPSGALVFHELRPDFAPTTLTETGTYRLVLNGLYDRTPSYSFQVRNTSPVIRNMQIGDTVSATISSAQSKDIWRFNATTGQSVYIDFQQATDNGVQYSLVAPNGTVHATAGNFVLSALDQGPILLNQSGTWELRINGPGTTTPTYRFQLWNVPAPDVYTVVLNDLYVGNIESPGREDVFEFDGYAGQQIYIDFQQNGAWLDWAFRKPDGTSMQSASAFLISQLDGGPITIPADGTYRLAVRGHGEAVGDFQLRFFDITPPTQTPILYDQIVTGSLNRPGQTPTFSFIGTVGKPLRLDVLFNQDATLAWTLKGPSGSTLFLNAATSQTISSLPQSGTYLVSVDQLNGAAPDTTGQFSFRVINPNVTPLLPAPSDLVVSSVVRPSVAVGTNVSFDVTWTVTNNGTGATTVGTWADRIYLSADHIFQRAADRIAGEFNFSGALAPGASYTQSRTITVPAGFAGDLTVIVETDALNQVFELTNEANNTLVSKPTAIYLAGMPDGPPAITLDVTDGQRFPQGSTITLSGAASVLPATVNLVFAIDLSASTADRVGFDANFDGIANAADDLNKDGSIGDILDVEIGSLIRILQNLRDNDINAMVSIVAFATFADHVDLSPLAFNQTFASPTADTNGNGRFDIDEAVLSMTAGRVNKFRKFELSIGTNFETTTLLIDEALERAVPAEKTQVIFLTDGGAAAPTATLLNRLADRGIEFFGFQISGTSVTSSLKFMADTIDASSASSGRTQLISDPEDLGAALLKSLQIVNVKVNGMGVQALDVNGHFFTPVTIQPGSNVFLVEATDSAGRTTSAAVTLIGIRPLDPSATQQLDVTHRATTVWTHTTFNRFTQTLQTDLALTNTSSAFLEAPVIAVFDSISPLRSGVGFQPAFPDNKQPFVRFDSEFAVGGLLPGQTSAVIPVRFSNPLLNRFDFETSLIAQGNSAPWFISIPSVEATTNVAWTSPLKATDPDGHALTYEIIRGPVGMTVTTTTAFGFPLSALHWTPSAANAGTHDIEVRVTDGHGGSAVQSWQLTVRPPIPLPNLAPWFLSTPVFVASTGISYFYTPLAIDPEGLNVSYQLVSGPAGLSLVSTGTTAFGFPLSALHWTPLAGDIGPHTIQVKATDPSGQAAFQTWTLHVKGPNTPPQITTSPVTSLTADAIYRYDVDAIDPDDAVHFELIGAPAGMDFNPVTGQIVWHTSHANLGSYPLTVNAIDARGAIDSQSFVLVVSPDTQAPHVTISLSNNVVSPGDSLAIKVNATDNAIVVARTLTVNGVVLALNANHEAIYTATAPGLPTIFATAVDAQGNVGTDQIRLRVIDPTDTTAPVITVTSPQPADVVTYLTDIVGSIIDANLESYSVAWSPIFANQWTTFFEVPSPSQGEGQGEGPGQGTGILPNVSNTTIATFDPTLLMNDAYDLRITATDISGNSSTYQFELSVEGNAKVGNFHLDFTDLTIPLAGIPITISRSYDTLMANVSGDFGYGWMMSLSEGHIRETRPVKENESFFDNFAFRTGTRVYINTPGGKRVGFTFDPVAEATVLGTQFHPRFTADPGVYERLEVENIPLRQNPDGTFKLYFGAFSYNPQVYTLVTKDQVRYTYDQFEGLLSISDRNDVRLTYTDNGITSSIGQSITWTRDSFGRITRITDPAGNHISYGYNTYGDLISVKDQIGQTTTMSYLQDRPHFLVQQIDSLGHIDFTATFDANGRLQTYGDALGNSAMQSYDLANNQEIIADRLGNESILTFDDRGNIISSTGPLGAQFLITYDTNDNQTSVTDPLGRVTQFQYDVNGNITVTTDTAGDVWRQTFNSDNDLLTATNPLGQTTQWVYDDAGNVVQVINAAGESTNYSYDSHGRVTSMGHAMGEATTYEYALASAPTRVIYPDGSSRSSTYDVWGDMTSFTNERGFSTTMDYDDSGRPVRVVDALGGLTVLVYDGPRLVSVTDPLGRTLRYEYDAKDRRIREINPAGGVRQIVYDANDSVVAVIDENGHRNEATFRADGLVESLTDSLGYTRHFTFDAAGNRVSLTDENGHVTRFAYDSKDRIVSMTDANGGVWSATWDALGNRTSFTDPNSHTTHFAYDVLNRLIQTTDALGGIYSQVYDEDGNVISSTDANGHTSSFEYDLRHRPTRSIDPAGFVQTWDYDDLGNITLFTDKLGETATYEFDALNRMTRRTDPLGNLTQNSWDAVGNLLQTTDPLNRVTTFAYDVLDRRVSEVDPRGSTTTVTYDAVGNVLSLADPNGNRTTYVYDSVDQLIQRTDPLGASDYRKYDGVGNLTQSTDRNGRVTEFLFDPTNQLIEERWLSGTSTQRTITYSFDPAGNLLTLTDPDARYSFTFDALNRQVTSNNAGTPGALPLELNHSYDSVGNVLSVRDNFNVNVTSTYDARDLLSTRTWSGPSIAPASVEMEYNARGQRSEIRRFSDSLRTHQIGGTGYEHDANGRLTGISHYDALDAVFSDFDFFYDDADQLVRRDVNGQRTDYAFDAAGQLTNANHATVPDEVYTYDANGNRTSGGRVNGVNNRLLADSQFTYAWDAEGNMVSRTSIADGSTTEYSFDHRNRLTRVSQRNSTGAMVRQTVFRYDAFNRRISKSVDIDGIGPIGAVTVTFAYDGDHVWADADASGNITARYLFGDKTDEILARQRPVDGLAWYLTDQLGSVHVITDAAGIPINQITYDSFGNVIAESNAAAGDRYRFTGREFDAETGLYYYRARYYSATLGIFISQDPISFGGGDANLYRYVANNPQIFVDPTGLAVILEGKIVSSAGKRAAAAFISGTLGYACGYLEAWYSNDPNPALSAVEEAVIGAAVGAMLGPLVGRLPGQFQLFAGIALAVFSAGSGDGLVIKGLRATCIVAEFAVGGGFRNLKHVIDDLPRIPKNLDDWMKSLRQFLQDPSSGTPLYNLTDYRKLFTRGNTIIGKQINIRPENFRPGDQALLTFEGMDWATNNLRLQSVMDDMLPILDLDILDNTGALGQEHSLLQGSSWQQFSFQGNDFWVPPNFFL